MTIALIGFSHHKTTANLRSQLAFSESEIPAALTSLQQHGFQEAIILSTCNRTEIYIRHQHCQKLQNWWMTYRNINRELFEQHAYIYQSEQAVEHAMRVGSGMDSMVLGEPQILGQFKHALQVSVQHNMVGAKLNFAIKRILQAAKQVRHQTAIGHCPVSVALSSLRLAQQHIHDLSQTRCLLIGAGETIKLMLKHIVQAGAKNIIVANRTPQKASALNTIQSINVQPLDAIPALLNQVDMIISATAADHPIITADQIIAADQKRQQPLILIDLAMPYDIEPCHKALQHIQQFNIDHIENTIRDNTLARSQAALHAYEIIQQHLTEYRQAKKALDASHTICAMRQQAETLKQQELDKARQQLRSGTAPEAVLEKLAQSLTNKWLHTPSTSLNKASALGQADMLKLAQDLFDLNIQQ